MALAFPRGLDFTVGDMGGIKAILCQHPPHTHRTPSKPLCYRQTTSTTFDIGLISKKNTYRPFHKPSNTPFQISNITTLCALSSRCLEPNTEAIRAGERKCWLEAVI